GERADDARLRLPALAEEDQVVAAEQRVLDRREHRVVVAEDAGEERLARAQPTQQVRAQLLAHAARPPAARAQLAERSDRRGGLGHLLLRGRPRRGGAARLVVTDIIAPMRGRTAAWLVPALVFAALHARALDYGFVWVDEAEIVSGTILRPPGRILAAFGEPLQDVSGYAVLPYTQPYYRPLQVVLAGALDAAFGREPRSFRAASLCLGTATAALFGLLALGVLGRGGPAALAASVVAAHPVGLEIYVWISGLSAALVGLFVVASLLAGERALAAGGRARAAWTLASALALALGLLSQEDAPVVPALQLALGAGAAAGARREGGAAPPWRALASLVAAQAALVALYLFALRPAVLGHSLTGAGWIGGSRVTQWWTSLAQWPGLFAWLAAPLHSTTSDAVRVVTSGSDPLALAGVALAAGSAVALVGCLRRGHGAAAAGLAWTWIAFLPTSGVAPLLHAHAERNLFLPAFGVALLWGAAQGALQRRGVPARPVAALAAALVLALP